MAQSFAKLESAKDKDEPVYFTNKELDEFVEQFPLIKSADMKYTSELATYQIREHLKNQLRGIKVTKNALIRKKLLETIVAQYLSSAIKRGKMVGNAASDAFINGVMQISLDGIHRVGKIVNIDAGINGIRSLLFTYSVQEKNKVTILHYVDRVNIIDVEESGIILIATDIMKFVNIHRIYNFNRNQKITGAESDTIGLEKHHILYEKLMDEKLPDTNYVMRLYLDRLEMYRHRVTCKMIADALINENPSAVVCVYSTFSDVTNDLVFDIFVSDSISGNEILESSIFTDKDLMFLQSTLTPKLEEIIVKGVPGIRNVYPRKVQLSFLTKDPKKLEPASFPEGMSKKVAESIIKNKGTLWELPIDDYNLMSSNAKLGDYITILRKSGLKYRYSKKFTKYGYDRHEALYFEVPIEYGNVDPKTHLANYLNKDDTPDDIKDMAYYVYAIIEGTNMPVLYSLKWVDKTRTYTNDPKFIRQTLGCEAARSFIYQEFMNIFTQTGVTISPRHISLTADFLEMTGDALGVTYVSLIKHKGYLSMATMERTANRFKEGAVQGNLSTESTTNPSIAILLASGIPVGSHSYLLEVTEEDVEERKRKLQETLKKKTEQLEMIKSGGERLRHIVTKNIKEQLGIKE